MKKQLGRPEAVWDLLWDLLPGSDLASLFLGVNGPECGEARLVPGAELCCSLCPSLPTSTRTWLQSHPLTFQSLNPNSPVEHFHPGVTVNPPCLIGGAAGSTASERESAWSRGPAEEHQQALLMLEIQVLLMLEARVGP